MLGKPPAELATIVRKAAAGEWADFSRQADEEGRPGVEIEAGWIRRLLTERYPFHGELGDVSSREPQVLRIRGLRIRGILDLSDCRGPEGRGCRPLLLEKCEITGDSKAEGYADPSARYEPALKAAHARWARLELKDCKIPFLDLTNAELLGDLRIEGLASLSPEGQCWVRASELRVKGSVLIKSTNLRVEPAKKRDSDSRDYALHLWGARILGSFQITDGFVAKGGVNLDSSRIDNDLWAYGAYLEATEGHALSCQGCRVGGVVGLFRPVGARSPEPFRVKGAIFLWGMEVSGSFHLTGAKLEDVTAPFLTVGGDLKCTGSGSDDQGAFEAHTVNLKSCQVEGDCNFEGQIRQLVIRNSKLRSALTVQGVQGPVDLSDCEIGGSLQVRGSVREHDARLVASPLRVEGDASFQGGLGASIGLRGGRFGGNLTVQSKGSDLAAPGIQVGGEVTLDGDYPSLLVLSGGQFRSSLTLSVRLGARIGEGDAEEEVRVLSPLRGAQEAVIDLFGVEVQRDLNLDRVHFHLLDWSEVKETSRIRARPVGFYPGWHLAECLVRFPGQPDLLLFSFLYRPARRSDDKGAFVLLDGTSPPIHELNATGAIRLDTDARRRDYLRFFCAHVWGEEGPFTLVETLDELPSEGLEESTEIFPVRSREVEGEGRQDASPYQAVVWYGGHLFQADFWVLHSGMVEMEDDTPIQELQPELKVHYEKPVRRVRRGEDDGRPPRWPTPPTVQAPEGEDLWRDLDAAEAGPLLARLHRRFSSRGRIQLQRSKVGAFNRLGTVRGEPAVYLNGFEYGWIDPSEELQGIVTGGAATAQQQFSARAGQSGALKWLEGLLQGDVTDAGALAYPVDPSSDRPHYSPHPYEQLAGVLKRQGNSAKARAITLARLRRERDLLARWWLKPFLHLFDWGFGYALKPRRAWATFFLMALLGTLLVTGAQYEWLRFGGDGPAPGDAALVVKVTATAGAADARERTEPVFRATPSTRADRVLPMPPGLASEVPCGPLVSAPLYALDVFVPFLDLHQESRCTISARRDAWAWRWGLAAYRIFGWLVTTLLVLTLTKAVLWHVESRL